jgi:hypothetical protein
VRRRGDAERAQAGRQLAADEAHAVRHVLHLRAEAGVDEHEPVAGPDQEAADRQPRRAVPVEQLRMGLLADLVAEVSRPGHEGAVRHRVQVKLTDPHVPILAHGQRKIACSRSSPSARIASRSSW